MSTAKTIFLGVGLFFIIMIGGVGVYSALSKPTTEENIAQKEDEEERDEQKKTTSTTSNRHNSALSEDMNSLSFESLPPTNIDTSAWKTYRDSEYGYELKYPNVWAVRKGGSTQFYTSEANRPPGEGELPLACSLEVYFDPPKKTPHAQTLGDMINIPRKKWNERDVEPVRIAGFPAVQQRAPVFFDIQTTIKRDDAFYTIVGDVGDPELREWYKKCIEVYREILRTVRFIDRG